MGKIQTGHGKITYGEEIWKISKLLIVEIMETKMSDKYFNLRLSYQNQQFSLHLMH